MKIGGIYANVEALAKGDVLLPKDDRITPLGFNFLAAEHTITEKTKCMKEYRKTATVKAKLFVKGWVIIKILRMDRRINRKEKLGFVKIGIY